MPGVRGRVPDPPLSLIAWGLHFAEPVSSSVPPPCRGLMGKTLGGGQERSALSPCVVLGFSQLGLSFS